MDFIDYTHNLPSPRCIKTHLPIQLLPDQVWIKKPKIIYIKRNFKDVIVSYYHQSEIMRNFCGSIEDFADGFMADCTESSPYYTHVNNYEKASNVLDNVMVVNYEDMKRVGILSSMQIWLFNALI